MRITQLALIIALTLSACHSEPNTAQADSSQKITAPTNQVKLSSEIEWEQLNPARGDQSPKAGTVWGDRKGEVATGFLAEFVDGFSSPPHIHNVTYRAVVISGLVHNDDPEAAKMWMPSGSFWTQPAGEAHITAVKGTKNVAYVEIDSGPYLVQPIEEAHDNGERPINIDATNIVWTSASENGVKKAYLWGDPENKEVYGMFIKLPAGYAGEIKSDGSVFRAVIIQGEAKYSMPGKSEAMALDPGSTFSSEGKSVHSISAPSESLIYIRTNGEIEN
jgi:hypothetical protein